MVSRNWQIHERRSVEARGIGEENSSRGWILNVDSPYVFSPVVYCVCAQSSYNLDVSLGYAYPYVSTLLRFRYQGMASK